ncbi:hypothetical protein J6590_028669, partial [Homalodisca vitripennis]
MKPPLLTRGWSEPVCNLHNTCECVECVGGGVTESGRTVGAWKLSGSSSLSLVYRGAEANAWCSTSLGDQAAYTQSDLWKSKVQFEKVYGS